MACASNNNHGTVDFTKHTHNKGNVKIHAIWNIPNFTELWQNEDIFEIVTPEVTQTSSSDVWKFQYKIMFYHIGVQDPQSYAHIGISYMSPTLLFLKSVQLKMFAFNVKTWTYEQEKSVITQDRVIAQPKEFEDLNLEDISILLNPENKTKSKIEISENNENILLLKNGVLRLKFEFVIAIENENHFEVSASELSKDLENILNRGIFTDVVIKSSDNEEFKAHKAVIAGRSPVFKAYFDHNSIESTTNNVETRFESAVLREVLIFIYTDKAPNVYNMPEKLLEAADYYQLNQLKSLCEEALFTKLDVDNAVELLLFADKHSVNKLASLALEVIKKDFQQEKLITKTEGWKKLESVDLLRRIYE